MHFVVSGVPYSQSSLPKQLTDQIEGGILLPVSRNPKLYRPLPALLLLVPNHSALMCSTVHHPLIFHGTRLMWARIWIKETWSDTKKWKRAWKKHKYLSVKWRRRCQDLRIHTTLNYESSTLLSSIFWPFFQSINPGIYSFGAISRGPSHHLAFSRHEIYGRELFDLKREMKDDFRFEVQR